MSGKTAIHAVSSLIEVLKDRDGFVRANAVRALAKIDLSNQSLAVPVLIDGLRSERSFVRAHARALSPLAEIEESAKDAAPTLIEALKDKSDFIRIDAAYALGKIGEAAVPALITVLPNVNPKIRSNMAYALGEIGESAKAAVPALIAALQDADARGNVVHALAEIGEAAQPVVPILIKMLRDSDAYVQWYAVEALEEIGILEAMEEAEVYVQKH